LKRKPPFVYLPPALDANVLAVRGCLQPGSSGVYPWAVGGGSKNNSGVVIASFRFKCEAGRLYLSYTSPAGGERTEIIPLFRVTRPLGGSRPYFLCPGAGCGRRVLQLYFSHGRFLCRHCSGLVYASRYEQYPWQRAHRKARRLQRRLGITGRAVPEKPENMRTRAYERLLEEAQQAEARAYDAGTARLLQLIGQLDRRQRQKPKPSFTL
jgi:hypothetical protein